jgi:hypothetical protein
MTRVMNFRGIFEGALALKYQIRDSLRGLNLILGLPRAYALG